MLEWFLPHTPLHRYIIYAYTTALVGLCISGCICKSLQTYGFTLLYINYSLLYRHDNVGIRNTTKTISTLANRLSAQQFSIKFSLTAKLVFAVMESVLMAHLILMISTIELTIEVVYSIVKSTDISRLNCLGKYE